MRIYANVIYTYVYTGTDRPDWKYLNRHVKTFITAEWYDIGVDLLDEKKVPVLQTIRNDHPGNSGECTTKMLELWLRVKSDASWNQLIQTFRQPNISLEFLAADIESKLLRGITTYNYINFIRILYIHINFMEVCCLIVRYFLHM